MGRTKQRARQPEPRAATVVDGSIGARIKKRRMMLNLSQDDLATALGVARQQVQKYEAGANRLSVSRLIEIAAALRAPVGWFFRDLQGHPPGPRSKAIDAILELDEILAKPSGLGKQAALAEWLAMDAREGGRPTPRQSRPPTGRRRKA